jgi:hypothetical protein
MILLAQVGLPTEAIHLPSYHRAEQQFEKKGTALPFCTSFSCFSVDSY